MLHVPNDLFLVSKRLLNIYSVKATEKQSLHKGFVPVLVCPHTDNHVDLNYPAGAKTYAGCDTEKYSAYGKSKRGQFYSQQELTVRQMLSEIDNTGSESEYFRAL